MSQYIVLCTNSRSIKDTFKVEIESDSPGGAFIQGVSEIDGSFIDGDFEPLYESNTKGVWVSSDPSDAVWLVIEK